MNRLLERLAGYISLNTVPEEGPDTGWGGIFMVTGSVIFAAGMPWSHVFGYIGAAIFLPGAILNRRSFKFNSGSRRLLIAFSIFLVWGIILSFSIAIRPYHGLQTVFAYFSHWMLPFAVGLWLPRRFRIPILYLWIVSLLILGFISLLAFLGIFYAPELSKAGMLFGRHNHIQLAGLLTLALVILYSLFLTPERSRKETILFAGGCVFLLLFIILTGSRSWWLAAAVAIAGATVHHIIINRGRMKALVVAIIGVLLVLGSVAVFPQVRARINKTGFSDPNLIHRRNMAIMALEVIKDNPFTGIGPGQVPFAKEYYERMESMNLPQETGYLEKKHFHNMYLQVTAEFGFPGAIIFIFILFQSFRILIASPARVSGAFDSAVVYGLLWSFVALVIAELFDCLLRGPAVAMEYFWVLGICAGIDAGDKSGIIDG